MTMRAGPLFERLSAMGAAAQASVPGAYAWAVSVAPAAWSRGASVGSKIAAVGAVVALGAGVAAEPRWGTRARLASFWGFILACALAWWAAPAGLGPLRLAAPQGLAGMVGWALFAFASAAPALSGRPEPARIVEQAVLAPRMRLAKGDAAFVAAGALLAVSLQVVGWRVATVERALLIRFVALAAGLAAIGATASIALNRSALRAWRPPKRRLRSAAILFAALAILLLVGLLFFVWA